uniref:Arf-GAP with coiled-coil, ANK repeat and PH domain-containing protein n=1 Tax=Xenopus tropicalis TaxID=8364 RepID=A0A803JZ92_XENTR
MFLYNPVVILVPSIPRAAMEEVECEVSDLESRLEKLVKLSSHMNDGGRQYCSSSRHFVEALRDLSHHSQKDSMLSECLERFSDGLSKIIDSHVELLENIQFSFKQRLLHLLKEDLRSFRDSRKDMERCREGLESALHHNAETARRKAQEAQDAASAVQGSRKAFRDRALEYALQINVIQGKKKFDILQFMLQLMDAQASSLAQSHHAMQALDQYRNELAAQVHRSVLEAAREQRDMEQKVTLIKAKDPSDEDSVLQGDGAQVVIEGYLFKRASNTFKTWSRRWFSIQNNQLVYQKKVDVLTVVIVDLRLCAVKLCPEAERRFCFEVVSPAKSCMLQAESDRVLQLWVSAVQRSITTAYSDNKRESGSLLMCELGNSTINGIYEARIEDMNIRKPTAASSRSEKEVWIRAKYVEKKFITKLPQSSLRSPRHSQPDPPSHSPKARTLGQRPNSGPDLKALSRPFAQTELQRPISSPGAQRQNTEETEIEPENGRQVRLRKATRPLLRPKPGLATARAEGADGKDVRSLHPGALLYRAVEHRCLPTMADALAHGADVNWVRSEERGYTPLIRAVLSNSLVASEFLLQNGASVNQTDKDGRGPLHHATLQGYTGLACLFLKRGADINAVDNSGKDVLSIAIENANADIVTLLRLVKMREADIALGQSGDETYLDIFRDFSLMASDAPEKLSRRSFDLHLSTL